MMNISDSERLKCLRRFFMFSMAGGMEISVVYMTVHEAGFPASLAGTYHTCPFVIA